MYPAPGGGSGQNPHQSFPSAQRPWDSSAPPPPPPPPPPGHPHHHHHHHHHGQQPPYRADQNPQPLPPVNGSYPQRQDPQIRPDRPEMASIQPQYYHPQQAPYLPAPAGLYPPHEQQYRPPPPPSASVGQSAPRQRTAIACKYCRRRKIRCSGFENSEDGRCSNCIRFSQECVFTPVSAQTQAFVPAQALYGRGARGAAAAQAPQQLYGPYGNRLPPQHEPYPPHPHGHPPPGYTLPSPTGAYPPHPGQQPYPYQAGPPAAYDAGQGGRRRDQQPPSVAPPSSGPPSHREDGGPGYAYPDPASYAGGPQSASSPASATGGYPSQPQPYYAQQATPRRTSPGSTTQYSYDQARDSHSPHSAHSYGYSQGHQGQPPIQPASGPQQTGGNGRTPPPLTSADRGRSGMSIHDIVSESGNGGGERSAADNSMVNALNRPAKR